MAKTIKDKSSLRYELYTSVWFVTYLISKFKYLNNNFFITGCAMVFLFIIFIMVIAICRVHLKRTALARYPTLRQDNDAWASILMQPRSKYAHVD